MKQEYTIIDVTKIVMSFAFSTILTSMLFPENPILNIIQVLIVFFFVVIYKIVLTKTKKQEVK